MLPTLRLAALRLERIHGLNDTSLPKEALGAIDAQCRQIFNEVTMEREQIYHTTVIKMVTYLRIYNVEQKSIDPTKIAYWFWESLIDYFTSPVSRAGKIVRLAMTIQMRLLLNQDVGKTLDAMMESKIQQTLLAGQKEEIFGRYGLYMIYKNCARLCHSNAVCKTKVALG